jgi:hypothetical protein
LDIKLGIRLTYHRTIVLASGEVPFINKSHSNTEGAIYNVTIHGLAYNCSLSPPYYSLVPSRSSSYSQYTVTKHSDSHYIVLKHISSLPISAINFSVKIIRGTCIIRREFGSSVSVKAYYSVTRRAGELVLRCFHGHVLVKVKGYTKNRLDRDAFLAFDVALFFWKLVETEGP